MTGHEQDPSSQWNQGEPPPPGQGQPPQGQAAGGQGGASQQGGPYGAQQGGPYEQPGGQQYGGQQGGPYGQPYGQPGGPYGAQPGGPAPPGATIKTYRTQAIIILLCCILFGILPLITGIPALVYSTRVTESIARGDFAKAVDASRKARTLCWISLGLILLVVIIIIVVVNASKTNSGNTGTGTTTGNT